MKMRNFLTMTTTCVGVAIMAAPVYTQSYPTQPIRMIVHAAPGGTTDVMGRLVAQGLTGQFGSQVVVENRTGAGGLVGTDAVAKASPDGYTLLFSSMSISTYEALYDNVPFDPVGDFEPVGLIATTPYAIVVHPDLPFETLTDLVDYTRENPDELTYAASIPGTAQHLAMERLKAESGADLLYVPYGGGTGDVLPDLLSGRLDAAVDNVAVLREYIEAGSLRPLAVTSAERSTVVPDVPTVSEFGFEDFSIMGWFGVFAPAGTPEPIVEALNTAINEVLADVAIAERLASLGAEAQPGAPEALADKLGADRAVLGELITNLGITPN